MAKFYKGFSTKKWGKRRTFAQGDIELVKEDLLNHIFTERGTRVMMPNFGTRIPVLSFEPNDPATLDVIENDLREVFAYDPRVSLITMSVNALPDNNAIVVLADVLYLEFNVQETLRIEIGS